MDAERQDRTDSDSTDQSSQIPSPWQDPSFSSSSWQFVREVEQDRLEPAVTMPGERWIR
jgi:hypothetical protein